MHHLRSATAVRHFRIAALLLFVICLLAIVAVSLLVQSMLVDNFRLAMAGSSVVVFSFVLVLPLWTQVGYTNCPLCWTPVLASMNCVKHRKARKLMGSYRLRVALAILFRNRFRCPYCNESTALELRHSTDSWPDLD